METAELVIDSEFKQLIPPLMPEEFSILEESIIKEGCREAIIIWDKTIIDGHNRYEICNNKNIPFKTKNIEFESRLDALIWIIQNQFGRRNLDTYTKSSLALKLKPLLEEKAKANQKLATGGDRKSEEFKKNKNQGCQNSDNLDLTPIDTKKELAKMAGVSHDTINKVENIEKKAIDELKDLVKKGEQSINQVHKATQLEPEKQKEVVNMIKNGEAKTVDNAITTIRKESKRKELEEKVKEAELERKEKKYRVIYADPPWDYQGEDQHNKGKAQETVLNHHYPSMTIEELCKLPIKNLTEENAVLFMWVTSPQLERSFEVIKAWGFKYKTSMVWDKVKHNVGNYVSVRHEFLLICTKGICTPDKRKLHDSVLSIERTEHSKKPEKFREIIDDIYTMGNRIELFRRGVKIKGWDIWGNEVIND